MGLCLRLLLGLFLGCCGFGGLVLMRVCCLLGLRLLLFLLLRLGSWCLCCSSLCLLGLLCGCLWSRCHICFGLLHGLLGCNILCRRLGLCHRLTLGVEVYASHDFGLLHLSHGQHLIVVGEHDDLFALFVLACGLHLLHL